MIELSFWQTVILISVFEFLLPRFGSVIKVSLLAVDELSVESDLVRSSFRPIFTCESCVDQLRLAVD